ncbi:hypothetical protein SPRG_05514 [Saprolegnia parasitica CBS 223.65]|uniref:MATE efflux family protein n=1 Tax=Saprolegnia parasitica (strain CBS 223.65) TaxID=695850 RepID=A0A067CGC0_SAPPC|nr:hypothetical protein SPRG_05514 [Saprolegnia parasitica CBS 223.65]KDO29558.1 hypothetical protein SPRG_05514 [Saprolegnia parasitica CBS 223.65]|eukprot:XP_012199623.1 hypothetical protein SPRG_05514 [Saprolegnia parasitica CBS 223.65]
MTLAFFFESLHQTISIVLVGRMDSPHATDYVGAATMASMYATITSYSVSLGLASALDTLCTQAHGAGNTKQFGVYFQSSHLGMAMVLIPVVLVNWFSGDILTAMGQDAELSALAGTFIRILCIGLPFYFVYQLVRRFLQAYDIVYPMTVVALLSNVVHIGLGYYLCYHTSLGFNGAAIARCVSYVVLPLFMLPYFVWRPIHREWGLHWNKAVAVGNLREFFRFGIPGLLLSTMEYAAYEILTLMAGWLPNHKVMIGINSIVQNVILMLYMVYTGISIATTIRVGNLLGANRPDDARRAATLALVLCVSCSILTGGSMVLARDELPTLFLCDPAVLAYVALYKKSLISRLERRPQRYAALPFQGIFRGIAKPEIVTAVNGGAYYLVGLPLAALAGFCFHWGINGVLGAFGVGTLTATGLELYQFAKIDWTAAADTAVRRNDIDTPLPRPDDKAELP